MSQTRQKHAIFDFTDKMAISPLMLGEPHELMSFAQEGQTMRAVTYLLATTWRAHHIGIVGDHALDNDLTSTPSKMLDGVSPSEMYQSMWDNKDRRIAPGGWLARKVLEDHKLARFRKVEVNGMNREGRPISFTRHECEPFTDAPEVEDLNDVVIHNLDEQQKLEPSAFGDTGSLFDVATNGGHGGTTTALAILLAASCRNGSRNDGDFDSLSKLVGSWAGDRIGIYQRGQEPQGRVVNISAKVRDVLAEEKAGFYYSRDDGSVARTLEGMS